MQKIDTGTTWTRSPKTPDLQPGQVDIWRISLDLSPATVKLLESGLSADESRRAARFRFPAHRRSYIIAHGALRHILACYLNCEPDRIGFSVNEFGKPALLDRELEFNLSHSGDFALVAVTQSCKIGVDVERIRPNMDLERMAVRFFSDSETSDLMAFPPESRKTAFFQCWTRKEAYIKAQGMGLSLPLKDFDVSLGDPPILRATRPDSTEAARWRLLSLEVNPGYAGAIAVEHAALSLPAPVEHSGPGSKGEGLEFRLWDWNQQET